MPENFEYFVCGSSIFLPTASARCSEYQLGLTLERKFPRDHRAFLIAKELLMATTLS